MEGRTTGARIIIVDDLPDHVTFAGTLLRGEGYRVSAATSGAEALRFLAGHRPDLIVLDIKMDDMDGLEVCRRIKSAPETREIPVIFVTAETDSAVITEGFAAGCCDYVSKPFVRAEYLARIAAHLSIARHAQELAAAYDELNLFCSAVSHDLKSPLSVIRLLLGTLESELDGKLSGEAEKIIEMLDDKAAHLTEMIGRLLEFSRMCNIRPAFEQLDLNAVFNEIFGELRLLEPERRITLLCGTLPAVWGDPVLVCMLLKNVLTNAFKFTRVRQNALITVGAFEENGYTVISVRDNGAGFDMQYADRLFGIFQRLHPTEAFEGTGVGLAMVDRIMKRHGGRVHMEGEVDRGAEIFLYFPQRSL